MQFEKFKIRYSKNFIRRKLKIWDSIFTDFCLNKKKRTTNYKYILNIYFVSYI